MNLEDLADPVITFEDITPGLRDDIAANDDYDYEDEVDAWFSKPEDVVPPPPPRLRLMQPEATKSWTRLLD